MRHQKYVRLDIRHDSPWVRQAVRERSIMVWSGLTVTVAGCLLRVDRDDDAKVARMVCQYAEDSVISRVEVDAVSIAADLLAKRARRVLGDWTVVELEGNYEPAAPTDLC